MIAASVMISPMKRPVVGERRKEENRNTPRKYNGREITVAIGVLLLKEALRLWRVETPIDELPMPTPGRQHQFPPRLIFRSCESED